MIPLWVYKLLAVPTGEFKYYRNVKHARQVAESYESDEKWWKKLQAVCQEKVDGVHHIDKENLA